MRRLISLSICIITFNCQAVLGLDKAASKTKTPAPFTESDYAKFEGEKGSKKDESGKDVDFGPYMADLQRRIKRAWFPPAGDETKKVIVLFDIDRAGNIGSLKITKPCGIKAADQACMAAVRNASPFRPLPAGSPEKVDIQFTFDYNVFKRHGGVTAGGIEIGTKHLQLIKEGRIAFLAKKYDIALKKFEEADKYSNFTERDIKAYKATIYDRQGTQILAKDPKAAAALYRKALLLMPNSHYVIKNLDVALDKQGVKGTDYKERAAIADKFASEDRYDLAEIEFSRALSLAQDAERNQQADTKISSDRRALAIKLEKIKSSIKGRREEERWRAYLEFNKTSTEAFIGLALALEKQGKINEAKKAIEDALAASPKNEAAELHLKRLQELTGDAPKEAPKEAPASPQESDVR